MSILQTFFEEMGPMCDLPILSVDISSALVKVNVLSPVKLPLIYTDVEKSLSGVNEVIVKNFASNFANKGLFSRIAMKAMVDILKSEYGDEEHDARKILLVHVTKANMDENTIAPFVVKCARMTIVRDVGEPFQPFKDVAMKVFTNKHVNTIIVECIQQYGIVLKNLAKKDYDIVYVSYDSLRVRGFSGINITYINKPHFETTNTIYSGKFVSEYLNRIMLVDVINCVVHEYAHVKMREHCDDFNSSSSMLARNNNLGSDYHEFGRLVEKKIFGEAIDWAESADFLPPDHLQNILDSIVNDTETPKITNLPHITLRESISTMALDCVVNRYFC